MGEEVPNGMIAGRDPAVRQLGHHRPKGQIRSLSDPRQQPLSLADQHMRLLPAPRLGRSTARFSIALGPLDRRGDAHPKAIRLTNPVIQTQRITLSRGTTGATVTLGCVLGLWGPAHGIAQMAFGETRISRLRPPYAAPRPPPRPAREAPDRLRHCPGPRRRWGWPASGPCRGNA